MTQNDFPVLDPNTADLEELQQLPSIGAHLASRIVEGRPYQSAADLRKVPGLGDRILEGIKPFLTFDAPKSDRTIGEQGLTAAGPDSKPEVPDQAPVEERKYPLVLSQSKPQQVGFWALLAVGAASVICSVTLTLSVMAGINGTLDVGNHAALQETRNELIQIRSQFEATQVELDALRGRAEVLEGVSGRMIEVEAHVAELQQQIDEAIAAVDSMETELGVALAETRTQSERVDRFQDFLDGLRRLIGQVVPEP